MDLLLIIPIVICGIYLQKMTRFQNTLFKGISLFKHPVIIKNINDNNIISDGLEVMEHEHCLVTLIWVPLCIISIILLLLGIYTIETTDDGTISFFLSFLISFVVSGTLTKCIQTQYQPTWLHGIAVLIDQASQLHLNKVISELPALIKAINDDATKLRQLHEQEVKKLSDD